MIFKRVQKLGVLGLATVLMTTLPGCLCYLVPGNAVFFPDQALESAIRAELRMPFGCITESDLLQVRELDASGLNIRDIRGLDKCRNLTKLNLNNNQVRNIGPLTNLENLTRLDLGNNQIKDIEAVAGLFFLTYLDLSGPANEVRDFGPLEANILADAGQGLGAGSTIILDREQTLAADGTVLPAFQGTLAIIENNNINLLIVASDGSFIEF